MPIYEYICRKCQHRFELLQRGNEKAKMDCPQCESDKIQKLFSVFGFSSSGTFVSSLPGGSACTSCTSKSCSTCRK